MFVGGFAGLRWSKAGSRIFKGGRTPKALAQPYSGHLGRGNPEDVGEHPGVDHRKAPIFQALELEAGERR